ERVNKLPGRQKRYAQGTSIDPNVDPYSDGFIAPVWIGPDGTFGDGSDAVNSFGFSMGSENRLTWGPLIDTMYRTGIGDDWDPNGRLVGQSSPLAATKASAYDPYDFFQTGFTFNNNIAVAGGDAKSGFRLSLGNLHQDGVIPRTNYNKTTISLSGQSIVSDKLTVSSGLNFIHSKSYKVQQGSNQSGIMLGLLRTPTTFDNANGLGKDAVKNPASYILQDGSERQRSYRGGIGYDNPYWVVNKNPFWEELFRVFGFAQASYQANDWLSATYRVGGDVYGQNGKNAFDKGSNAFSAGALHLLNYFYKQFNSDFTVTMKKKFSDDWNTSLLLGHNYYTYTRNARLAHGSTFTISDFYDMLNIVSAAPPDESTEKKRTMAFYGEAHIDYKDMLFLTLTGRRETSSTLPEKNNSFFYPSAGLAWEFTRLPDYPSGSILNYGKIRASFAQVGKDAPVQGLQTYYVKGQLNDGFTTGIAFPMFDVPGIQLSSTISTIGNSDLKAEKTNSYELGADLNFYKNRISFNGTYYYSKSSDVILVAPLAYSTGYSSKLVNAATIRNQGWELTLNTTPVKTKDLTWDMNFNWSRNRNRVLALATGIDKVLIAGFTNGEIDAIAGKPFGQIYGNIYVRSNPDDMNSPLLINDDPSDPGYGMPIVSSQSAAIGDINPDWTGSVINNLAYKGWTLGVQLDVRKGGDIWNGTKGAMSYFGTSAETDNRGTTTVFNGVLGHLNDAGEVVNGPGDAAGHGAVNNVTATYNQYYWQNIGSNFIGPSEAGIEDGSFVRIRQVSVGYDLPKSFISKARLAAMSVTLFANNPVLWTKYSGVDPETSLAGPANGQGLDYFNNPGTKSYGIRLNVAF
ncbi:MAG TPA: TonB-dependent receptor, partial [Chitinophagaceae bacterium]|nr:TonB-dependent receptor [Chitinophagaceae bacterium]